ncbi:hypothetical protein D770_02075 [Flammeovirgaceae bacterium 311]|nr:hypothetical protein D770_02075 [Flammeovirgaceae bacterium 311]
MEKPSIIHYDKNDVNDLYICSVAASPDFIKSLKIQLVWQLIGKMPIIIKFYPGIGEPLIHG